MNKKDAEALAIISNFISHCLLARMSNKQQTEFDLMYAMNHIKASLERLEELEEK